MANIWDHPEIIAAEALTHMEDNLVIAPLCAMDKTSDFTSKANGWKVGDVVSFRTHGEYEVDEFAGSINIQNITTSSRSMTIEKHLDISVEVTAREETLDLDSFSEQVIIPASYKLAEKVDTYLGGKILQGHGLYLSSTLFESAADIALARKAAIIQQLGMNRNCLIDLDIEAILLGQAWFNQAQTRGLPGVDTLQSGVMGKVMGMDFASSIAYPTNLTPFTASSGTATTNNAAGVNNNIGSRTLVTTALSAAIVAGCRLQINGCRRPLLVSTNAALGATSVLLVDPITEKIAHGSAVTVIGAGADITYHGAIFDNRSLAVGFPMLDKPGDKVTATAFNNGLSIRIVKGYDMQSKKTTLSMDCLVGGFALDPRRITLLGSI